MTIAEVGSAINTGNGSTTVAVTYTVTAGSLLLVFVAYDYSSGATASVSDDRNGSYGTVLKSLDDTADTERLGVWVMHNAAAGSTVFTATFSVSSGFLGIWVEEFSGAATSGAVQISDGQIASGTGTDGVSSGSFSASSAPAMIVGFSADFNSGATWPTAGTGFTSTSSGSVWSAIGAARSEWQRVTSTGSYAATFTTATNHNRPTLILILSEAGPTGPVITVQPVGQIVALGQTATFTVTATGVGTLHYQWKKNGSNVGTDSSSYTTPNVDMTYDGAIYTVVVTDDNGSVTSANAVIRVVIVPIVAWFRA